FEAEDGIRDWSVTGVQTCALPISDDLRAEVGEILRAGQLEPPSPKDFPNFGSQIIRLRPQTVPMLPFVQLPRPLQESNVVGKGEIGRASCRERAERVRSV